MPVLKKLPLIRGQKQQYECPECKHVFSTGKKNPCCPGCKVECENPDKADSKKKSSIKQGPGPRSEKYIKWRDQIVLKSKIKKGMPCPCCGEWIDRQTGQVELHHILRRQQFPELVMAVDNVFVGCSNPKCGDALDFQHTTLGRLTKIREMGARIIRAMVVPPQERPRSADQLADWCYRMHDECGVPVK